MTQTTTTPRQSSPFGWIASNFIQLVAIAVIFIEAVDVIVVAPKEPAAAFLRDTVSLGTPFAILITIIMTLKVNYTRLTKSKTVTDRFGPIVFFISFISMFVAQFLLGADHPFWVAEYDLIYVHGSSAVECLCAVAIMMMLIRDIRPRSIAQGYVILIVALGIMVVSPVGDFLPPTLLDIANWFAIYPSGVGGSILTFGLYMGLLSLVVRVFLFKEKLRVGAD
jgi:hypothetical protein